MVNELIRCNIDRLPRRNVAYGPGRLTDPFMDGWNRPLDALEMRDQWRPPVDIVETEAHFAITLEAPGLDMDALDIVFSDGLLTVKGEKTKGTEVGECCHCSERYAGAFERRFRVSGSVDVDNINAAYKDGILKIVIPKKEEMPPRKIEVH